MSIIYGTINNETLDGTSDADVIFPKGGVDIVRAGAGDDEIVLDTALGFGSTINGGNGFDTLVLRTQPGQPYYNGGTVTLYNAYFPTGIASLEAVRFESSAGDFLGLNIIEVQRAGAGLTTLIGGAGRDGVYDIVFTPGEYTMPVLTFQNWNSDIRDRNFDFVTLIAAGSTPGNYILNAREGLATIQGLQGNSGNDVLNGSSGSDALNGGSGVDQLFGNGGDDILIAENLTPFGGVATTLTYAGSTYSGGSGEDALVVGGRVDFQGTLAEIENIFFEAATVPAPGFNGLDPAHLILSGTNALTLASNAKIDGNGTLEINLGAVTSFNASAYKIGAGYTVDLIINGTSGNDSISGSMTNDIVNAGDGNDMVFGNGGADSIYGGLGNDTLIGGFTSGPSPQPGDGADMLDGGAGNDLLRGGDGDDTLLGGADDDNLRGDAGNDTIDGGDGFDVVSFRFDDLAGPVNIDMRSLTSGSQSVSDGRGGTDSVSNVELLLITGSAGNDTLRGSTALKNQLAGFAGNDRIFGGNQDDLLFGDDGLGGVDGDDTITGNGGADTITGGAGNDTLIGGFNTGPSPQPGDGADMLDGGAGNDVLRGGDGDDTLIGGLGDDNLRGDEGNDTMDGGDGIDFVSYRFDDLAGPVTFDMRTFTGNGSVSDGRGGIDILSSIESLGITGSRGGDTLYGSTVLPNAISGFGGADRIYGGNANDTLFGDDNGGGADGGDLLRGFGGDDIMRGGAGNDTFQDDAGNDTIDGGSGTDTLFYIFTDLAGPITFDLSAVHGGTQTVADGRGGFDTVSSIENLAVHGTTGNDTIIGSRTLVNSLAGNAGDDTVIGGEANDFLFGDQISGPDGNDLVIGNGGADIVVGDGGDDTLIGGYDASPGAQPGDLGDTLDAGAGNDVLRGGDGDDTLLGGLGDDNLRGDAGNDIIDGGDGTDFVSYRFDDLSGGVNFSLANLTSSTQTVDDGRGGTDTVSNIETVGITGSEDSDELHGSLALRNIITGRGGSDLIFGGDQDDQISGDDGFGGADGEDFIYGKGGADSIYGGAGDDYLIGGYRMDPGAQPGDLGDYLDGGAGNDRLFGGDGDDTLIGGIGGDTLQGDAGNDTIDGGDDFDTVVYRYDTVAGPVQVDMSRLASGTFTIDDGRGGTDTVSNVEKLVVTGSIFNDELHGSLFLPNVITGFGGADRIFGGNQNDFLSTTDDDSSGVVGDEIHGGLGADLIYGGGGDDILFGGLDGRASTQSGDGADEIAGRGGNDTISGGDGNELLFGEEGDDTIRGDAGDDFMDGGPGFDTLVYRYDDLIGPVSVDLRYLTSGQHSVNDGRGGTDTVTNFDRLSLLGTNYGDTLWGSTTLNNLLSGNGGNDTINGGNLADVLDGGLADDILNGGGGADTLIGGAGMDTIDGGLGVDTVDYAGSSVGVQVNLASGKGKFGDANGDTYVNVENAIGSAFADILTGSKFANRLEGGAGADRLIGGLGADELFGGTGADVFVFTSTSEIGLQPAHDSIGDFEAGGAGSAIDRIDLSAIDAISKTTTKDDAFTFIGAAAFSGKAGELRVVETSVGHASVFGDVNGDAIADFQLDLSYTGTLDPIDFLF